MLLYVVRRLLWSVAVVLLTAVFAYGGWRFLRGELPENQPWLATTLDDLERLLHGDLGTACSFLTGSKSRPCPATRDLFDRGWQADVWMVGGAIAIGTATGILAGLWAAANPRAWRTRALEAASMAGLCTPPFVLGYGLLLLFASDFGRFRVPLLFDVHVYQPPYVNPWDFVRALLVPWLVAAAPVAAIVMRITRSAVVDAADEDFMRTAIAKGLTPKQAIYRHGRPLAYPTVFSWLGTAAALIVTNVLIIESVFSVPGFLYHTRRAFKPPADPERPDFQVLQAEAIWIAVLVVVLALVSDLIVMAKDPRVRQSGRLG